MGLDMWAYRTTSEMKAIDDDVPENVVEFFYWRKHPDLHGWMEKLYRDKGGQGGFNCANLVITSEDLDELERDVRARKLPETSGFFFGQSTPEDYDRDLLFIELAREFIAEGDTVFYTSWW